MGECGRLPSNGASPATVGDGKIFICFRLAYSAAEYGELALAVNCDANARNPESCGRTSLRQAHTLQSVIMPLSALVETLGLTAQV
jgi:hypothetical protein